MQYLGLLFTLALLAVNLWGLMLITGLYWRNRWFALAAGPILAVTGVYAIESQHGLGPSLAGLCILSTLLSIGMIVACALAWEPAWLGERGTAIARSWRAEFSMRRLAAPFGVFAAISLYAMVWRFTSPDIDGSSEKIADLSYICSYLSGATIPVPDVWLFPYPSTQYYSFQYYGAALMGRILLLSPGTTYNIGYCLLVGLCGTAFSGFVFQTTTMIWVRALVISGFIIGGTGVTLIAHATDKDIQPWTNERFIGSAKMDKPPVGTWLRKYQDDFFARSMDGLQNPDRHMELPGEIFSYIVYLGDFHPPFSGYYLMGICAMAMLLWARSGLRRYPVIAGGTLTWTLIANTWVLPLHALALMAWLGANWRDWRRLVPALAAGAAVVWLAAWVYLSEFTASAAGYGVSLKMVPWKLHTPPLMFGLFFLPTIALIVLGFFSGDAKGRRLSMLWVLLLVFSEYFYVKDIYSGMYERFNTTLKWWPWVMAGTLMTLGPVVLEQARRRWVPVVGVVFCLYPCLYIGDLWKPLHEMWQARSDSIGQLDGTRFLTREEFPRLMLGRLKLEKPGIVIEHPDDQGGFVNSAVLPLFAGQRMWIGWFGHENLWHGYPEDIRRRHDRLMLLYRGEMKETGTWLVAQGIDYVLWYRQEDTPELWEKVNKEVQPEFIWCDILTYPDPGGRRVGFWKRNPGL